MLYSECACCNPNPLRPSRVSIDRRGGFTLRLSCKQGPSRDHGWPSTAHPQIIWFIPSKGQEQTSQQLHAESPINLPDQKLWIVLWKRGCRWLEWSLVQYILSRQAKQNTHTHTLFSPSSFPCFSKAICREEESTRKRRPFVPGYFCIREESAFCLWDNSVSIKALIGTVFCRQPGLTPLFLRFGSHRRSKQEEEERSGECGNVSTSSPRRGAPKHGFKLGEKKTQAKKRQALNYTPAC